MAPSTGFYTIIMIMMATVLTRSAAVIASRDNCSGETMTPRTEAWSMFLPKFASGLLVLALPELSFASARNSSLHNDTIQISALVIALSAIGLFLLISTLNKKFERTQIVVKIAAESDPLWDRSLLIDCAREAFFHLQKFANDRNWAELQLYTTAHFIGHQRSEGSKRFSLGLFGESGEKELDLKEIDIVEAFDSTDRNKDRFCALMSGLVLDKRRATDFKRVSPNRSTHNEFGELWHFRRVDNLWLLDRIETNVSLVVAFSLMSGSNLN